MSTAVACPAGFYCPIGSEKQIACPEGTYSNYTKESSNTSCKSCPPGKYCNPTAQTYPTGKLIQRNAEMKVSPCFLFVIHFILIVLFLFIFLLFEFYRYLFYNVNFFYLKIFEKFDCFSVAACLVGFDRLSCKLNPHLKPFLSISSFVY